MATKHAGRPTAWSHAGLVERGYQKCPYCPRHLVKIEEHVAAHRAGRIGPDGRRRDRARGAPQAPTAPAFDGGAMADGRRVFVPREDLERLFRLPSLDPSFTRDVDGAVDDLTEDP